MYQYWCNDCHELAWVPKPSVKELQEMYDKMKSRTKSPEFIHDVEIRELSDSDIIKP